VRFLFKGFVGMRDTVHAVDDRNITIMIILLDLFNFTFVIDIEHNRIKKSDSRYQLNVQ
jgi:hypothetical protein